MKLNPNQIYHIYNRGNNKQQIFFDQENYHYFLKKVKLFLTPYCEILAFALMPNHFHFLICPNERSNLPHKRSKRRPNVGTRKKSMIKLTMFSWGLQHLLSSYARGINQRYNRTGSLFQQNTKSKKTSSEYFTQDYSLWCFIYIHNNPKVCGMVNSPEEYEFSSYRDYLENRKDSICNLSLGRKLLSLDMNELFEFKSIKVPNEVVRKILR